MEVAEQNPPSESGFAAWVVNAGTTQLHGIAFVHGSWGRFWPCLV